VTFDPTPSIGRTEPVRTGFTAQLQKYAEALELLWFQYVVGYDKQEQRSLATQLHNRVFDYGRMASSFLATVRGYMNTQTLSIVTAVMALTLIGFTLIFGKRFWRSLWGRNLATAAGEDATYATVDFYERLINALEQRGMSRDKHQTPLEFANTLDSGQAMMITRAYNRVRFGRQRLTATEKREIEKALFELESTNSSG
jgi:hypothetical protein